jgi:hypothetical protein
MVLGVVLGGIELHSSTDGSVWAAALARTFPDALPPQATLAEWFRQAIETGREAGYRAGYSAGEDNGYDNGWYAGRDSVAE